MKPTAFVFLFLMTWVCSCEKKVEQPTLSDEKLSRIMADVFTAEAATNGLIGYPKDSLLRIYLDQVLLKHQVSKEEYEKNLRLITNDIPHMERVIDGARQLLEPDKKKEEGK
jgi:hypothetical protein